MVIKYRTTFGKAAIERLEFDREDAKAVYIQKEGRVEHRVPKVGGMDMLHDTWEAAREYLIGHFTERVRIAQRSLDENRSDLALVQGMICPDVVIL